MSFLADKNTERLSVHKDFIKHHEVSFEQLKKCIGELYEAVEKLDDEKMSESLAQKELKQVRRDLKA